MQACRGHNRTQLHLQGTGLPARTQHQQWAKNPKKNCPSQETEYSCAGDQKQVCASLRSLFSFIEDPVPSCNDKRTTSRSAPSLSTIKNQCRTSLGKHDTKRKQTFIVNNGCSIICRKR